MTAFPVEANYGMWWVTTFKGWHRLHAVPGDALTVEDHREAIDAGEPYVRTTACGRTLPLTYAGMFSRFSMPRCAACCDRLGVPRGDGTPVNEAAEKRLKAEREAAGLPPETPAPVRDPGAIRGGTRRVDLGLPRRQAQRPAGHRELGAG